MLALKQRNRQVAAVNAVYRTVNPTVHFIIIFPTGLNLQQRDDCRKLMKQARQQTPFQKYVEEFVLKIACVRATALLSNRVMRL